jgi:hypothetical protein
VPAYGRLVEHDERSRAYGIVVSPTAKPKTVLWAHRAPVLDQKSTGSCTGDALGQLLNTDRFAASRLNHAGFLTQDDALALYSLATRLDNIPGEYPPTDTGSSGNAVAKAGVRLGYLTSWNHAFGFDQLLIALQTQPVIVGTEWTDAMEDPNSRGYIRPSGSVVGGHEYVVLGADVTYQYVTILNSWSDGWGVRGRAKIRFADFRTLLANQGDVTVPIGR